MNSMSKLGRFKTPLQIGLLITAVFTVGFIFGSVNSVSLAIGDTDSAFEPMYEVFDSIQARSVEDIVIPELVDGAIRGMVDSLGDQFSSYLDAGQYEAFNSDLGGEISGIGVVIRFDEEEEHVEVVRVLPNAPALAAGVEIGDVFVSVDGIDVLGYNQSELADLVRGPSGSDVEITFLRGEELITLKITRARFEVPNVEYEILEDTNIAYIKFASFSANARERLDEAIRELDVNSRDALIFDIRGNGGGLLTAAVDIASGFIDNGDVILYESFGDGTERDFKATGASWNLDVPIVLLVDEFSASASELLAGAMQDWDIATLIGETTFGKGTVQNIQPLSNGGALRLTIARWLTPNRNWIHEQGVTPDIVIEWEPESAEDTNDLQLQEAIDFVEDLN